MIGTLREGRLHRDLKAWYALPGDRLEQEVDGYVVDIVREHLLVEIQTGSFSPLRRKLSELTETSPVRLVAPVPLTRRIVRLDGEGAVLSARRSPRRGRLEDVFSRLVSIPALIGRPTFELDVLLTHEEEHRVHGLSRSYRRHGWTVVGRSLIEVERTTRFASAEDFLALLPGALDDPFDTSDLAAAFEIDRRLAQQMAYCLREMDVCRPVGRRGRAVLYARGPAASTAVALGRPPVCVRRRQEPARRA